MTERYRQCVAVIVTDGQGNILLCERSDRKYSGSIQTVQGGIEPGETPREAAARELGEELGLQPDAFVFVDELDATFTYRWNEEYLAAVHSDFVGQEQRFFLAQVAHDAVFDLEQHHREFARVMWGTGAELLKRCWERKRPGFAAALAAFGLIASVEA